MSAKLRQAEKGMVDEEDFLDWVDGESPLKSACSATESTKSRPSTYPEIAANAALVLIAVACALLDRQIKAQAEAFEKEGGFTERLYRVRQQRRG